MSEFSCFDVLSFTETWLNDLHSSDQILFPSFKFPERKDRIGDRHGGVILYVINNVAYKRRYDLELNRLENIWAETKLSSSRNVLYGVFYRPPNADSVYNSLIEDSISLAVDTGIPDIIIMGGFNWNSLQNQSNRKTESVCNQFNLVQCIEEPTHFNCVKICQKLIGTVITATIQMSMPNVLLISLLRMYRVLSLIRQLS